MTLLHDLTAVSLCKAAGAALAWGTGWVDSLGVLIRCSDAVQWDKEDITVPIPYLVVFLLAGQMF